MIVRTLLAEKTFQVHLSVAIPVGLHHFLSSVLPLNGPFEPLSCEIETLLQLRRDQMTGAANKKHGHAAQSPFEGGRV